jgi:hypothetical protein
VSKPNLGPDYWSYHTRGSSVCPPHPFYNQTDLNIKQSYNIGESKAISFDATITNLLNQRAVTAYTESVGSQNGSFKQCDYSSEWFCTWRMHGSGELLADLYGGSSLFGV